MLQSQASVTPEEIPTASDAIKRLTAHLLSETRFRIPLTRLDGEAALAELESQIKLDAIEAIKHLSVREFCADWTKPSEAP